MDRFKPCIFSCNFKAQNKIRNKPIAEQGAAMSALTSQGGSTMQQLEESDEKSADLIASTSDVFRDKFWSQDEQYYECS